MPRPELLLPAAFAAANLIMYGSGCDKTWKLAPAIAAGQLLFALGAWRAGTARARTFRTSLWIVPWLAGHVLIGYRGRYDGGHEILPAWIDILVVIAFSLVIFYYALATTSSPSEAADAIAKDAHQLDPHAAP